MDNMDFEDIINLTTDENNSGERIDKFLSDMLSSYSRSYVQKLISDSLVLVDNKNIKSNYKLRAGDAITIYIPVPRELEVTPENIPLDIIYEDDNIIVVNKPSKLLTISNKNEKDNTLYRMVSNYLKKEKKKVFVIHRLDYDTSGIIMFAKNKEVQELYQSKWNELAKIREYTAIVEGITDNKGHIESYLKQTKTLLVYSSKNKDGYFAVTDYERIMYNNKYSMLKIHISTGRRNQIRCHMHDIKHPILGDSRYNSKYNPLGRLALHANKLVITNPISKKELTFVSKIPLEFYNLVK